MKAELLHEIGAMRFHRVGAEIQNTRDFLVGFPLRDQLQHFLLAFCQQIVGVLQSLLLQAPNVVFEGMPGRS